MLITKYVEINISGGNQSYYRNLGYTIPSRKDSKGRMAVPKGTKIRVKVEDLAKGSHAKVEVACDYCGFVKTVSYKDYLHHHDENLGDCCHKCADIKYKRTMLNKYGVENSSQLVWAVEKAKETNQRKYGCDWHMQRPEYQKQLEEIMQEKYGVKRPLQHEEFLQKQILSRREHFKISASKPQLELYNILNNLYPQKCYLEFPCDKCLLDIMIDFGDIKIDVEYDGKFWHQDEQIDIRRNNFLQKKWYKILRIIGNKKDILPSEEIIKDNIEKLCKTKITFIKIEM